MGSFEEGKTVGRYVIEELLGEGGMGKVYRALDTKLRRRVALKVIAATRNTRSVERSEARLVREAQLAAALSHPNVVTIYDVGELEDSTFIAMELLDGVSLRQAHRKASLAERLRWLVEVARALRAAHAMGLVHRDIKPDNVMVCMSEDGGTSRVVKVLDFGIAKRADDAPLAPLPLDTDVIPPPSFRTAAGLVVGTPRYMAPEQVRGQRVDARADQFAWGLLAYEILSGAHASDARPEFAREHEWARPPRQLSDFVPELAGGISAVVWRALRVDPLERFASMDDLLKAFEPLVGPESGGARPLATPLAPTSEDTLANDATESIDPIGLSTTEIAETSAGTHESVLLAVTPEARMKVAPVKRWPARVGLAGVLAFLLVLGAATYAVVRRSATVAAVGSVNAPSGASSSPSASASTSSSEPVYAVVFETTSDAGVVSESAVLAGLRATEPKIQACLATHAIEATGSRYEMAVLMLDHDADGNVTKANVGGARTRPLLACVEKEVSKVVFTTKPGGAGRVRALMHIHQRTRVAPTTSTIAATGAAATPLFVPVFNPEGGPVYDKGAIHHALLGQTGVQACFKLHEAALVRAAEATGNRIPPLQLKLDVDARGRVDDLRIDLPDALPRTFGDCIETVVRGVVFPERPNAKKTAPVVIALFAMRDAPQSARE